MSELNPRALSSRIDRIQHSLKCLARTISDAAGVTEQEVETLISEAPINNSTQTVINNILQQLEDLETELDVPPSFSNSNEFQI